MTPEESVVAEQEALERGVLAEDDGSPEALAEAAAEQE
jgi:hypothetical protein